ncbi:MAG: glycosyltransferase [Methanomassiliicoccales archaeon]|nr:glycosyltransferase [Methanomassiliicoccales archaeon]
MMRCAVMQAFPPHKYNLQAPTANPFQLLKHAPMDLEIDLYYFSGASEHRASSEACINLLRLASARELPRPEKARRLWHLSLARARGFPGSVGMFPPAAEIAERINESKPDLVWMYPHWLIDWMPKLKCSNVMVSGPDSAVLHNERALGYGDLDAAGIRREKRLLRCNLRLEKAWGKTSARMHMVGQEDVRRYLELNNGNAKAFYVPHPLYDVVPIKTSIAHRPGKLRVFFSGGGGTVFVGSHLRRAIDSISMRKDLSDRVEFRFVGKGYEEYARRLENSGFATSMANWVDSYEEELATGQVHIFPIAVGTGTKGKVLTALGCGLLCIGSNFTFENIQIDTDRDCLRYRQPEEVAEMLSTILDDRERYSKIALATAEKVKEKHSSAKVSAQFWNEALNP